MGKRNYLVEGVSGTGKTSVAEALAQRGYRVVHGDRELRRRPPHAHDAATFGSAEERHASNLWDVAYVRHLAANQDDEITFFCGGSRNFDQFLDVFDGVFVLDVDLDTLNQRLDQRPDDWGKTEEQRRLIVRLHATKEDIPQTGIVIDATPPLEHVVDTILGHIESMP